MKEKEIASAGDNDDEESRSLSRSLLLAGASGLLKDLKNTRRLTRERNKKIVRGGGGGRKIGIEKRVTNENLFFARRRLPVWIVTFEISPLFL